MYNEIQYADQDGTKQYVAYCLLWHAVVKLYLVTSKDLGFTWTISFNSKVLSTNKEWMQ